jgi:hypothetical protein
MGQLQNTGAHWPGISGDGSDTAQMKSDVSLLKNDTGVPVGAGCVPRLHTTASSCADESSWHANDEARSVRSGLVPTATLPWTFWR